MLKIAKVTRKDLRSVKRFDDKEWHRLDRKHYGRPLGEYMDNEFYFMATENGGIAGTIKGKYEMGVVFISALIVAEEKRRQAIGKKLLNKVGEHGKKLGCHKIYLFTGKNWKANEFYRSLGFAKTGELLKHYNKRDFYIYEKNI